MLDQLIEYYRANAQQHLHGLIELLRFESISTLKGNRPAVEAAAAFVALSMKEVGLDHVEIIDGGDLLPLVIGQRCRHPGKPVVLFYTHFDVQPVDPLDKWVSPPFQPTIRDGKLFARGAADSKCHLWAILKAMEGLEKTLGDVPVNVKVIFESEEESGGHHISKYVASKPDFLKDVTYVVVLDSEMHDDVTPAITTGLRGIVTAKVKVTGLAEDKHSGLYGGLVPNAGEELAKIIAKLKSPRSIVSIPGFYDGILPPTQTEKRSWSENRFDEAAYLRATGAKGLVGDRRFSPWYRLGARPTLEVNGFQAGYTGEGFKTVIGAEAVANISMRLVPGQDPVRIGRLFQDYLRKITPRFVKVEAEIGHGAVAFLEDPDHQALIIAADALAETYGRKTAFIRCGGTIPICLAFQQVTRAPVVVTGFVEPGCNLHAPNEWVRVSNWHKGIEFLGRYLVQLGR